MKAKLRKDVKEKEKEKEEEKWRKNRTKKEKQKISSNNESVEQNGIEWNRKKRKKRKEIKIRINNVKNGNKKQREICFSCMCVIRYNIVRHYVTFYDTI